MHRESATRPQCLHVQGVPFRMREGNRAASRVRRLPTLYDGGSSLPGLPSSRRAVLGRALRPRRRGDGRRIPEDRGSRGTGSEEAREPPYAGRRRDSPRLRGSRRDS